MTSSVMRYVPSLLQTDNGELQNYSTYFDELSGDIDYYFALFTILPGIVFNLLAFCVFSRRRLVTTPFGLYSTCLSIVNTFILTYYIFFTDSNIFFNYNLTYESNVACKLITFLRRVIRQIPQYIECLITLDRFLSVLFPCRFLLKKKPSFIIASILLVTLVLALMNAGNFWYSIHTYHSVYHTTIPSQSPSNNFTANSTTKINYVINQLVVKQYCTADRHMLLVNDLTSLILRTLLPACIMLVLDVFIVRTLFVNKARLSASQSMKAKVPSSKFSRLCSSQRSRLSKEYQFTYSVGTMNAVFLLLNIPVSVTYILKNFYEPNGNTQPSFMQIRIGFAYLVAYKLANLHYASLFFSNLAFNHLFRQELKLLADCCRPNATTTKSAHATSQIQHQNKRKAEIYVGSTKR